MYLNETAAREETCGTSRPGRQWFSLGDVFRLGDVLRLGDASPKRLITLFSFFLLFVLFITLEAVFLPFLFFKGVYPSLRTVSGRTQPRPGVKVWWNDMRPVHSILWGTFAYMAYNGSHDAWKVLALDVTIGFSAWVNHRIQ